MKTIYEGIEIDFNEVVEVFERLDSYSKAVLVHGEGSDGHTYSAYATLCCDEIELDSEPEIELVTL